MDPLETIFLRVAKEGKDKKKYIFFKDQTDIAFLYASGFVDAKKYSYKAWVDAFEPSKQEDNSYVISHAQWMDKKKYHYDGPINPPWDPMTLEEKEYTEKEVTEIIAKKIIPCTVFDDSYTQVYVNNLKAQGRLVNGKARIDKPAKEFILSIINQYPSPMRVLEVSVYGLLNAKKGSRKAAQENLQKSGFAAGATAQQIFSSRLADLAKTQPKEVPAQPVTDKPAVSLKDLQKRRAPGKI
jgi:hypothetical protein